MTLRGDHRPGRLLPRWGAVLTTLVTAAILSGWVPQAASADDWAPPKTVYVATTGHTVDGLFLDAWRAAKPLLGQPLTEEMKTSVALAGKPAQPHTVQYYENLALVYAPEDDRADWKVQALPLGRAALSADAKKTPSLRSVPTGTCAALDRTTCVLEQRTGHTLRFGFKAFWETNGGEPLFGLPISEEIIRGDGLTTQYFENAVLLWKKGRDVAARPVGKEETKRLKLDTKKIAEPDGVPVYDESLFQPPAPSLPPVQAVGGGLGNGPGPQQGSTKEIVVSIAQQSMWAYEGGKLVITSLVSTGVGDVPETVTPTGSFSILAKYDVQTMEGTISDVYYKVPDVPFVMYFDNSGDALHGTYWHNNFGQPMSHGCVNLPMDVAAFLYDWAPIGTPVSVLG